MSRPIAKLRNIGIIAHIDAGKTTVTERMLFYAGATHRAGRVDDGTTTTDDDPEEQERGITIYSACVTFDWNDVHINLLDTPGHVDFTAEVERSLRVLDSAVVVFSAREGVEAQSETVWRQANKYHVPRLAFINKLDREGANFEGVFQQIVDRLAATPVAIQIPLGSGPPHQADPFRGVIDLVEMELLTFSETDDGRTIERSSIPEESLAAARTWRAKLIDKLSEFSDELMELALQEHEIPADLIRRVLRDATLHLAVQPVLCGSALKGIGVQPVIDAVAHYLPSPLDMPPVEGTEPETGEKKRGKAAEEAEPKKIKRGPDVKEPFCGLVFKVLPMKTGNLYWVRIYSGELKANSRIYNPGKDKKENVAQLWQIHATKKRGQLESVRAGDIVCIIGPRDSVTGDTFCDAKAPILLEAISFPETVIAMAIEPESAADRKKLAEVLEMLELQDPTFDARESEETGQTIISGMGELHLEIIRNRLLRDFNLNVKVHKPRVSYRETIARSAEVSGECHREIGGEKLFARVDIRMEPNEGSETPVLVLNRAGAEDGLPPEMLQIVLEELRYRGESGGAIAGFPLMKLKVTVLGGATREEGSTETAFRIAASAAFDAALEAGGKVLLEPIMKLSISTPEEYQGNLEGDLLKRRGMIVGTEARGDSTIIEAHAPLAELFGYSSSMRGLSKGRASCSMQPLKYAPAPQQMVDGFGM